MKAGTPERRLVLVGRKTGRGPIVIQMPSPAPKPASIPSAR